MKKSPLYYKSGGRPGAGSPISQKVSPVGSETKGSKEIEKGIKNLSDKALKEIIERNAEASSYGWLPEGGEYRTEMPDFMKNIAASTDSVRAASNILINKLDNDD
jgi:hypothetical protein